MTFAIRFPKQVVAILEAKPYIPFWQTFWGKLLIGLLVLIAAFWYIVYPIYIPIKWWRQGRDPSASSGQVRAWFDPPEDAKGRKLTPEESGALIDEHADMEDVSGMLIALAQKGYFRIEERKQKDFYLIQGQITDLRKNELLPYEKSFIEEIFKDGEEFHLKKHKLYKEIEKLKSNIYDKLVEEGFFAVNPNKIRTFYSVIGVLALTTLN